jgi:hypothetical protein
VFQTAISAFGDNLPAITDPPHNVTVAPGNNAFLSVSATGATSYQWRFNGADIVGGTIAGLTVTNAQFTNAGYYYALAKNAVGWVPSAMAYLSVVDTAGQVPFSNRNNPNAEANYQSTYCYGYGPITNGTAQLMAGPTLDQMQAVGATASVPNGFWFGTTRTVPTVAAGQTVYYQIGVSYPTLCVGGSYTQLSTVLKLVAGGGAYPVPSSTNLYFPPWIEWPEPLVCFTAATNQVRVPGETFTLTNMFGGYTDLGVPTFQWRRGGKEIGVVWNFSSLNSPPFYCYYQVQGLATLTFTNIQPSDAGVYDVEVLGNNWFIGPKTMLSVQLTNGPGVFQSPHFSGSNFISTLLGAPGRSYTIQWSTNLSAWTDVVTLTNVSGTVAFTNAQPGSRAAFYRARLLP